MAAVAPKTRPTVLIVMLILASSALAAHEAVIRLLHLQHICDLFAVAAR